MSFNLLLDSCFPVRRLSGASDTVRFLDLCEEPSDPPVAFDWPRADLNIASSEFMIGVLAMILQLEDHEDWQEAWRAPADAAALEAEIAGIAPAFVLDGAGPRFMQDAEAFEGAAGSTDFNPVEALFIDTPGFNGQKKNTDLLTHRDRYPALGLPAAAIALYALQQFAPSGGAGNRTSLRGGGPMTTLALLSDRKQRPVSLWRMALANLPLRAREQRWLDPQALAAALPWLAPTLTSEKGREISEADPAVHPLQVHFGMPRRIRLVFSAAPGICALTGSTGPVVAGFVQKPWGVNYGLWQHPLTPYRRQKEADPPYSVKPKSGRIGYRDWVGVTVGARDEKLSHPAAAMKAVLTARANTLAGLGGDMRLLAAGWAMNNMEAETFLHAEQPLHLAANETARAAIAARARSFAEAGDIASRLLRYALNDALFGGDAKSTDTALFAEAADAFFTKTETEFHDALREAERDPAAAPDSAAKRWLALLRKTATDVFDRLAPPPEDLKIRDGRERVTSAYNLMGLAFAGRIKNGHPLYKALGLPVPLIEKPAKPKTAKAGKGQPA